MKYRILLLIMLVSILTSCSLLGPVSSTPTSSYMLNAMPLNVPHHQSHGATLLVVQPDTIPAYNTTQMAYSVKPYQISYFGLSQWSETPSQMLQPLLVQTLTKTHYYKAIVTPPYSGRYDYALLTQILRLQQNFTCLPNMVEFTVRAQILRTATNQVIATKQFTIMEPILQKSPYGGVFAANHATVELLHQITEFTLKNTN